MRRRLFCATSNPGKLAEFQAAAPRDLELVPAGPCECPETGATFEDNARQKALCYAAAAGAAVFADDSGLVVDVLGGEPGIHSARFAGPQATDEQNNARLLDRLRPWRGPGLPPPAARFVCAIALVRGREVLATFQGTAEGTVLETPRGRGGFGYDPLFYFPPLARTFAELPPDEKFLHSHRGHAFRGMLAWLGRHPEALTP